MNILILNWRDIKHPLSGGAEVMLFEHAKYWQKKGAYVTWFSSGFGDAKNQETINEINIIRQGSQYTIHLYGLLYYLTGKLGTPDLVIDCFHGIPFFSPLFISQKKIIALIHEVAGKVWFANSSFIVACVGYCLERISFFFYTHIKFITVSQSTKNDLIQHGISSQNISIIHNGLTIYPETKSFKKDKNPTILFLGRLSKDKGIFDVLKAYKEIKILVPEVKLWVVGKEEKDSFKSILKSCGIEHDISITYFGFVSEKLKCKLLAESWVLLHPSVKEGWGLTVIEAAAQGTPTVGYDVEGLRDSVVQGKTGMLVKPSINLLVSAVVLLLTNQKKYNEMSKNAITWSNKFNWENSVRQSWEIIHKQYASI